MLTSIDVKFIFDSARLGKYSPNSRCRSSSCLLAVLAMCLAFISPSSYSWNKWNVRFFCFHNQNNSTSFLGLFGWRCINLQERCTFDVIGWLIAKFFQIWSSVAGYGELCMAFSQSESEKYFGWIIIIFNKRLSNEFEMPVIAQCFILCGLSHISVLVLRGCYYRPTFHCWLLIY